MASTSDPSSTPQKPAASRRWSIPTWLLWLVPITVIVTIMWFTSKSLHGEAAFIMGTTMLVLGGHWLVESSIAVSRMLGMSPLVIGLTVVAFGTSAPELALNLSAAINSTTALSFGNVVGSNIANITLVLGCAAVISPLTVHNRVVERELPWLVIVSLVFCGLAFIGVRIVDPATEIAADLQGWGFVAGLIMVGGFVGTLAIWYRSSRGHANEEIFQEIAENIEEESLKTESPIVALLVLIVGIATLGVGGRATEWGAVEIASQFDIDPVIVGLTIVAVATSLPEVTTSVIASIKNENDLAVGNVLGSNIFNILLVMGSTAMVSPVAVPPGGWIDLGFMLAVTIALLLACFARKRQLRMFHGVGLLMLFAAFIAMSITRHVMSNAG